MNEMMTEMNSTTVIEVDIPNGLLDDEKECNIVNEF
jgi:hypothetical protein